jgi:hypothetical protein
VTIWRQLGFCGASSLGACLSDLSLCRRSWTETSTALQSSHRRSLSALLLRCESFERITRVARPGCQCCLAFGSLNHCEPASSRSWERARGRSDIAPLFSSVGVIGAIWRAAGSMRPFIGFPWDSSWPNCYCILPVRLGFERPARMISISDFAFAVPLPLSLRRFPAFLRVCRSAVSFVHLEQRWHCALSEVDRWDRI